MPLEADGGLGPFVNVRVDQVKAKGLASKYPPTNGNFAFDSYDQLFALAKELQVTKGGKVTQYGLCGEGWDDAAVHMLMATQGTFPFDAATKTFKYDSPAGIEAMQLHVETPVKMGIEREWGDNIAVQDIALKGEVCDQPDQWLGLALWPAAGLRLPACRRPGINGHPAVSVGSGQGWGLNASSKAHSPNLADAFLRLVCTRQGQYIYDKIYNGVAIPSWKDILFHDTSRFKPANSTNPGWSWTAIRRFCICSIPPSTSARSATTTRSSMRSSPSPRRFAWARRPPRRPRKRFRPLPWRSTSSTRAIFPTSSQPVRATGQARSCRIGTGSSVPPSRGFGSGRKDAGEERHGAEQYGARGVPAAGGIAHAVSKVLHRPQFWFGFVTLAPLLAWYSVVSFWSVIQAFRIALIHYRLLGPGRFVGLDNFRNLFDDPLFGTALKNSVEWGAISVLVGIPLALGIALCLAGVARGRNLFQSLIFVPVVVPLVSTILIAKYLLDPAVGPDRRPAGEPASAHVRFPDRWERGPSYSRALRHLERPGSHDRDPDGGAAEHPD